MSLPKSSQAYHDCADLYDRALRSIVSGSLGVRLPMANFADANYMRMRMNQARVINRRDNSEIFSPGEPLYQASVWDALVLRIKIIDDKYYLYVEPSGVPTDGVEEIPPDDTAQAIPVIQTEKVEMNIPKMVENIRRRV